MPTSEDELEEVADELRGAYVFDDTLPECVAEGREIAEVQVRDIGGAGNPLGVDR